MPEGVRPAFFILNAVPCLRAGPLGRIERVWQSNRKQALSPSFRATTWKARCRSGNRWALPAPAETKITGSSPDVPENNPFGVFIRTPHVDRIAELMDEYVPRPGGILRHREWGLYEVAIGGPDNLLVRIGWPSSLIQQV